MENSRYPFQLEPLPYSYDALSPNIDETTLHFHHDKHLQTYVDNLNKALEPYPQFQDWTLERLCADYGSLPPQAATGVRNNAGGVYNHQLYFRCMTGDKNSPSPRMERELNRCFGSLEEFQKQLKAAALARFGSGWAYLVQDPKGDFKILSTANQDTPLPQGLRPLLLVDVWEHAYYLQYQNRRAEYLDQWFPLIEWRVVEYNAFQNGIAR